MNKKFKRKYDDAQHEANLEVLRKLRHKYVPEYWRTWDMHGSQWHDSCKVCGDPREGTALHYD